MNRYERVLTAEAWRKLQVRPGGAMRSTEYDPKRAGSIDLYWWWHDLTKYRVFIPTGGGGFPSSYSFIAEGDLRAFCEWSKAHPLVTVTRAFADKCHAGGTPPRFFTLSVEVPRMAVKFFSGEEGGPDWAELAKTFDALVKCDSLLRIQLGFERGEQVPQSRSNDNDPSLPNEIGGGIRPPPTRSVFAITVEPPVPDKKESAKVVIGIIDDGAAFAHASVRAPNGNGSRVALVWNQTHQISHLNHESWWKKPRGDAWHGAVIGRSEISALMKPTVGGFDVEEEACYRALVSPKGARRALRSRESHGAAVLACAAGSLDATNVIPDNPDSDQSIRSRELVDPASSAPVIFVDLPYEQIAFSSGRWMPVCALDGVRFIVDRAREMYASEHAVGPVPVAINISSGSSAGPHDGSSMIESALREILDSDPLVGIAVAAGNSRLARSHVVKSIVASETCEICVRVPPGKRSETYVEMWPELLDMSGTHVSYDTSEIHVHIKSPSGERFEYAFDALAEMIFMNGGDNVVAGACFTKNAVQSINRPMGLLVVAATTPHEHLPSAPYGNWIISCVNKSPHILRVNAWIERDELVLGVRRPQLAHFIEHARFDATIYDWEDDTDDSVVRQQTTSNMSNIKGGFSVAAGVGGKDFGFVSPYSGGGGGGSYDGRPLLMARADRSLAQPGVPAWGSFQSARRHMNGTSIAAPLATRWLANGFARSRDRLDSEVMAQWSQPRLHPLLRDSRLQTASGEGRLFIETAESPPVTWIGGLVK